MAEHNNPKKNASYCTDMTSYEAIENVERREFREYDRYRKFIGCLFRICELSGFYIEELTVKDKSTGKHYTL